MYIYGGMSKLKTNTIYHFIRYIQQNYKEVRGEYDKFPDIFRMGTFIESTDMKL